MKFTSDLRCNNTNKINKYLPAKTEMEMEMRRKEMRKEGKKEDIVVCWF